MGFGRGVAGGSEGKVSEIGEGLSGKGLMRPSRVWMGKKRGKWGRGVAGKRKRGF